MGRGKNVYREGKQPKRTKPKERKLEAFWLLTSRFN